MKVITFLAIAFLLSCQSKRTEALEDISESIKEKNNLLIYSTHEIEIVDGCEYIHFYPRRGFINTVHKANCNNSNHK